MSSPMADADRDAARNEYLTQMHGVLRPSDRSVAMAAFDAGFDARHRQASTAALQERVDALSADIEALLGMARSDHAGDDEYEDIVDRWRSARGEAAYDGWRWWWREGDDDSYRADHATREAALAEALREAHPAASIHLIEARCWADDLNDGDEIMPFADMRNSEIARATLNNGDTP